MNDTASTMVGWSSASEPHLLGETYLNNLLAREDTPRDGVGTFTMRVGSQISLLVDGIISDSRVSLDASNERAEQLWGDEELQVGLRLASPTGDDYVRLTFWYT